MLIVARGGEVFARLRLRTGPGAELMLPVAVDFCQSFPAAALELWDEEYRRSVRAEQSPGPPLPTASVWDWPAPESELEGSTPSEHTDRHSVDQESLCEQFFNRFVRQAKLVPPAQRVRICQIQTTLNRSTTRAAPAGRPGSFFF